MRVRSAVRMCSIFLVTSVIFSFFYFVILNTPPPNKTNRKENQLLTKTQIFPQGGEDVKFDQTWNITTTEIINDIKYFETSEKKYLISNFSYSKGLGNLMFQYASLQSLALSYSATLILPSSFLLRRSFPLPSPSFSDIIIVSDDVSNQLIASLSDEDIITLQDCCSYHKLEPFANGNTKSAVIGYLQNKRYFTGSDGTEDSIRKTFTFYDEITQRANDFLSTISLRRAMEKGRQLENQKKAEWEEDIEIEDSHLSEDLYYVGIHVRHGMDITMNERNQQHGHISAPMKYYQDAMKYIQGDRENVVFIVSTDNIAWARRAFSHMEKGSVFFCDSGYREVDMSILSLCNSLILSTGTFSWWSGFLNYRAEQILYYSGWPQSGSPLDQMIDKSEYFPKHWTSFP